MVLGANIARKSRPGASCGVLALFLASFAMAQEQGAYNSACFRGIVDADSPAVLSPCDAQDALNVESNLTGTAILKRKGYQVVSSLTVATGPVTGSHSFIDASGNRQDIVCHDRYCAKSTNGNAFSNFLSTAGGTGAVPTWWSWVDSGGVAYGANSRRDPILSYNGTILSYPAGMPLGAVLEMTQDRMVIGDIQSQPNRVHYSSAGAVTQFTTGVNGEDSYFDDVGSSGDRVRCLKYSNGLLYIFKSASITGCELGDQYTTRCAVMSTNLGATDCGSVVAVGSSIYFRAQDKNYWGISGNTLNQISSKIPNLVKSQSGGSSGGEQSNTQTSQSDWQAGTQGPSGSWNTTVSNGSILPSSATLNHNTSALLGAGTLVNIDTTTASTAVRLSSNTLGDNFSDGNYTSGPVWTVISGAFTAASNRLTATSEGLGSIDTPSTISTGSFTFDHYFTDTIADAPGRCSQNVNEGSYRTCFLIKFVKNTGGDYYALRMHEPNGTYDKTLQLIKNVSASETVLAQSVLSGYAWNTNNNWLVVIGTSGQIQSYLNGVFVSSATDTAVSGSVKFEADLSYSAPSARVTANSIDNLSLYQYRNPGSIVSAAFDTAFLSPTYGQFTSTFSVGGGNNSEGQVVFYTQTSNDGNTWDTKVASSDTLRVLSAAKRYVRYEADIATYISTKTPTISAIALNAASTGYFYTQCIQPNSSISGWGTLSCAETKTGAGSLVYYATSAATCASLPATDPSTWQTTLTNNATVTIATNTAVAVGFRSLLGSATDQAQVDSCILNWNEGAATQQAWGVYDSIKNAVYWTTTINNATSANRLLKYDRNLEAWYPFSIAAQAPRVINNSLYFGGSSAGTWNLYGGVDADAGSAINAYWKSKDIGSDAPFQEKSFDRLSILSRNNGTGDMTATYTYSNAETGNYTISLSTGLGIVYARSNFNLPITSPQVFVNVQVGNNSSTPFEVLGMGLTWSILPWAVNP